MDRGPRLSEDAAAARAAASATLAVVNTHPPLRAEDVGYIELVASPDPRVAPMIFALFRIGGPDRPQLSALAQWLRG